MRISGILHTQEECKIGLWRKTAWIWYNVPSYGVVMGLYYKVCFLFCLLLFFLLLLLFFFWGVGVVVVAFFVVVVVVVVVVAIIRWRSSLAANIMFGFEVLRLLWSQGVNHFRAQLDAGYDAWLFSFLVWSGGCHRRRSHQPSSWYSSQGTLDADFLI